MYQIKTKETTLPLSFFLLFSLSLLPLPSPPHLPPSFIAPSLHPMKGILSPSLLLLLLLSPPALDSQSFCPLASISSWPGESRYCVCSRARSLSLSLSLSLCEKQQQQQVTKSGVCGSEEHWETTCRRALSIGTREEGGWLVGASLPFSLHSFFSPFHTAI